MASSVKCVQPGFAGRRAKWRIVWVCAAARASHDADGRTRVARQDTRDGYRKTYYIRGSSVDAWDFANRLVQ